MIISDENDMCKLVSGYQYQDGMAGTCIHLQTNVIMWPALLTGSSQWLDGILHNLETPFDEHIQL